jgi:hypothetical protein
MDVRFGADSGLKSDITALPKSAITGSDLLDHLIGAGEQSRWKVEAESLWRSAG